MALLTLKNIGKIYVAESNVAVGIRGVNLSFEKGEFVAITGKSGSGKSTLLNVVSGMDTYEEGELLIEGASTAHYQQEDWETYRNQYISFIFQDYNIIESFTVLQNVELALMHISDPKERRRRAIELLERVGLGKHLRQKGSKLSGGQKQRTVIARALAKDSPIILADEPTGNLDSRTSKEIIELLREVSKDKLLIVVTHSYDEVEAYATRHIRIYDGAVESDETIRKPAPAEEKQTVSQKPKKYADLLNGFALGRAIFTSKPKLSLFLCLLLLLGTAGVFTVTSFCGSAMNLFKKETMFTPIDGRVVLTKRTGEALTEEELKSLAEQTGANDYLHNDSLLDKDASYQIYYLDEDGYKNDLDACRFSYQTDGITPDVGRIPQAENELLVQAPISYKPLFGSNTILLDRLNLFGTEYTVVGADYYCDNNVAPTIFLSRNGFRALTTIVSLYDDFDISADVSIGDIKDCYQPTYVTPCFEIPSDKACVISEKLDYLLKESSVTGPIYTADVNIKYYAANDLYDSVYAAVSTNFTVTLEPSDFLTVVNDSLKSKYRDNLLIGTDLLLDILEEPMESTYRQGSLFFASRKEAAKVANQLSKDGYIAVTSDTTYSPDPLDTVLQTFVLIWEAAIWLCAIVFLAFFIHLCTGKTAMAFREDMAIMRSMGIPVRTIRVGIYVRMLISLIPGYLFVIGMAILIFTSPSFNAVFTYLYFWQYLLIFAGMLLLTFRVTKKQIHKLFSGSVKESIRGGDRG